MFGALQGAEYSCGVGANYWIERWFGDCVYTPWDTASFCIGLSSVFFWLIAQLPQLIINFLNSAAEALSPWFLAQWLAGDTFNFVGCVLTGDQLKTQTITAGYFIFADIVIISQYVYYQVRNRHAIDFDESTHKGSEYSDAVKSNASRDSALEKLIDQTPDTKAYKDYQVGVNCFIQGNRPDPGLCEAVSVSAYNNWVDKHVNLNKYISSSSSGDRCSHHQSVANSTTGAIGNHGGSSKQVGRAIEPSDCMRLQHSLLASAVPDLKQQDSWMYEHRHRLRRLVQEYGLEYGHGTALRLSSLYNNKRNEKYNSSQPRSSRKALENPAFLKTSRYKAVLGIGGIFGLFSTANLQGFSGMMKVNNSKLGFTLGRRALLALHDAGGITAGKTTAGQPAAAYIAGQLLSRTYPWMRIIGRSLGWGSSALYLGSRLSQIIKNKQRRSAEGLSMAMVTCAVLANVTYGTSIIMRGPSWDNLIGKAPWLVGSFGTVFLDFSIFIQAYYYSWHSKKDVPNEYTPLLA